MGIIDESAVTPNAPAVDETANLLGHHVMSVKFDPVTQGVSVSFNPQEFRTFEFAMAILEMAKEFVKATKQQALEHQAMQQWQANQIAKQISPGRH